MLFHVYDDPKPEGYYINEPFGFYRTMLDADWLLYVLLPFLLIIVVIALMVGWHLHEIPKHKAEKKNMRQAELVSALTLLGLLEHWVWAVALFIAFMDWAAVEDWMVRIMQRSRHLPESRPDDIAPPVAARSTPTLRSEPGLPGTGAPAGSEELPA